MLLLLIPVVFIGTISANCVFTTEIFTIEIDKKCAEDQGFYKEHPSINFSNSVIFNLKEIIYNGIVPNIVKTKSEEKKVVLYENQRMEKLLISETQSNETMKYRRIYLWYEKSPYTSKGDVISVATTWMYSSTECDCKRIDLEGTTGKNEIGYVVYARNGAIAEAVVVTRIGNDVPLSDTPDQECFDWQVDNKLFQIGDLYDKFADKLAVTITLTHMMYRIFGKSYHIENRSEILQSKRNVTLREDERTYEQIEYTNHISNGFPYLAHRNITLFFRGDWVYAGLAVLFDQVNYYNNVDGITVQKSRIGCMKRTSMPSESVEPYSKIYVGSDNSVSEKSRVGRLDFYVYENNTHPDVDLWRDTESLIINKPPPPPVASKNKAGSWNLQLTIVLVALVAQF